MISVAVQQSSSLTRMLRWGSIAAITASASRALKAGMRATCSAWLTLLSVISRLAYGARAFHR
jgi:hypothetical protein